MAYWICGVCNCENLCDTARCEVCGEPGNPQEIKLAQIMSYQERRSAVTRVEKNEKARKTKKREITRQIRKAVFCGVFLGVTRIISWVVGSIALLSILYMVYLNWEKGTLEDKGLLVKNRCVCVKTCVEDTVEKFRATVLGTMKLLQTVSDTFVSWFTVGDPVNRICRMLDRVWEQASFLWETARKNVGKWWDSW